MLHIFTIIVARSINLYFPLHGQMTQQFNKIEGIQIIYSHKFQYEKMDLTTYLNVQQINREKRIQSIN